MDDKESWQTPEVAAYAIDPKKEKKLVRKLDAFIIPPVMLLYLLSFLDRYRHLPTPSTLSSMLIPQSQSQHWQLGALWLGD